MKNNLYIMAGGKSSRFGGNPKILETFEHNKFLKDYFNVFIVTSKETFTKIRHLDADFIIQEMGNGSGSDVFNLFQKFNNSAFVCWSDVFYDESIVTDIINAAKNDENCMTITERKNPYISIETQNGKITKYLKNQSYGFQDNSFFYIKECKHDSEEFLDLAIKNNFSTVETNNLCPYFNTLEELQNIKTTIKDKNGS